MEEKQIRDGELYNHRFPQYGWHRFISYALSVVLAILAAIMLTTGVRTCWDTAIGGVEVSGQSMDLTLFGGDEDRGGDKLLVLKTGWWHQADYGDIVVVQVDGYTEWQGTGTKFIIKRLIAKEGDSVYCEGGIVYLKKSWESEYTALDEPYAYYDGGKNYQSKATYHFASESVPYEVGEGEIFFLGDNRFNSQDSRYREGESKLSGRLYKEADIYGTVPSWAVEHKATIAEWLFK